MKANLTFNEVVRTSDTLVTITLLAEATYDITSMETIRLSVPATAVTGTSDIVALPSFKIDPLTVITGIRVAAATDDAEEMLGSGAMDLASLALQMIDDSGAQRVGLRFQNVAVPTGAVITAAYVEFTNDVANPGSADLTIEGQAADNPGTFASGSGDITSRPTTSASVPWAVPAWDTAGQTHQSPSLVPIVQELIDRPGWTSGNALVVLVSGTGRRTARSYDANPAEAPLLHIDYVPDDPACDDGNPCTYDFWDAGSASCLYDAAAADGAACSDGLYCSTGNVCSAGSCGLPIDCSFMDTQCAVGVCDEAADACLVGTESWFDTNWLFRKPITIDSTKVTGDLDDFPVLVSITDPDLAASARADGFDIAFTGSNGSTKLDHEIEKYDGGTGELVAWVRVRLSASQDKNIYMYYGNATAGDQQNATGVWNASYISVYHMKESPDGSGGGGSCTAPPTVYSAAVSTTYAVPAGCDTLTVKAWRAGGGGGGGFSSGHGAAGGGGGFAQADISVTPGESLTITLGGGGAGGGGGNVAPGIGGGTTTPIAGGGTGGNGAGDAGAGGGGGGYAAVLRSSTFLVQAGGGGGGGGGGDQAAAGSAPGGAGGGTSGLAGTSSPGSTGGGAGTASAGGAAGSSGGTAGSANSGGNGGNGSGDTGGGGGGGGGRFGAGGGGRGGTDNGGSGGGGGSGFVTGTNTTLTAGSGTTPGANTDPDYAATAGVGGAAAANGNPGRIVLIPSGSGGGGGGVVIADSTANAHDGTTYGTMDSADSVAGQIANALDFDGTDDEVNAGDPANGTLDVGTGDITVAAWVKTTYASTAYFPVIAAKGAWGSTGFRTEMQVSGSAGYMYYVIQDPTTNQESSIPDVSESTTPINDGLWHHVVWVYDRSSDVIGYTDGLEVGRRDISARSGDLSSTANFYTGRNNGGNYWQGSIDEVRISTITRSAAWIQTEYNNQSSPSAFYSVAAEQGYLATCQDCNDSDPCTVDSYDSGTQTCINDAAAADGLACSDGLFCTIGSTCSAGACGAATDCSSLDSGCAVGTCDEAADACVAQSTGTWYDANWTLRKTVTVDSTQVTADLTDFPVLVSVTDTDLAAAARADGFDIVFTDDDETTKLAHEIERYNPATGELIAWVKVPNLTGSTDKVLYMYYGNATAANQQNSDAVWDANFASVHHLKEAPASGSSGTASRVGSWTTGTSHTVGAGSDRLLLFVTGYENGSSNDTDITAVSYGGQSLTPTDQSVAGTSTLARVELWYLNEIGIQAATGTTFSVTYGNGAPSLPHHAAATYQDIDQTTPIADTDVDTTTSVDPIDAIVNITTGAIAVSGAFCGNSGTYAWGNGWTEGTDQINGSSTMSTADNPATGGGTDTASADHSSAINRQVIVAATLNPASSGGTVLIADSTSNANDGTTNDGMDASDQVTGQIGYGLDFDGSDDFVDFGSSATLKIAGNLTVSTWFRFSQAMTTNEGLVTQAEAGDIDGSENVLYSLQAADADQLRYYHEYGVGTNELIDWSQILNTGQWYRVTVRRDVAANTVDFYVDGAYQQTFNYTNDPDGGSAGVLNIARNTSGGPAFEGIIDEARISSAARSADWILTGYNNQSAPGAFLSLGAEETASAACGTCDDGNPCTIDTWDSGTSTCIYDSSATNGLACSDGLFCTTGNLCAAGVCGTTTDCSFLDGACQIGVCDEPTDSCMPQLSGVCGCDDGNACTVDSFDTVTFTCVHDPAPVDGLACDDGLFCTVGETCSAGFCRSSVTYDCTSLDGACQSGVCDEGTDACVAEWHGTWKDVLWGFRKTITVDQTKVPSAQTDYPMLVSLADADLAANARSDGRDIFFTEIDGITKLDHELERYTSSTGMLVAWVRIPSLTSSADKQIYMYYGNSAAAAQENPTAVWDANYKSVYHMNQDPSSSALGYVTRSNDWTTGTSHTAGSGDDRLLLFATGHENASVETDVTAVSYGGQAMTQITETQISQPTGGGVATLDVRVSASTDDAEEHQTGTMESLTSSDLELIQESDDQVVGMRFLNLGIPQGANVTNAYIEFTVDETDTVATNLTFRAQAADNPATFSSTSSDITSRPTTGSVAWNSVPSWSSVGATFQTPDLSSVVQEVVDRAGWGSGNALVMIVTGTGKRVAESYDGSSANAPLLHVEYDLPTYIRAELWYLNEAGIQAASGSTFSPTYSNGSPDNSRHSAVTYRTVDQSSPIGDSDNNATLTSDPITRSVTVSTGSMAVAGAVSADSSSYTWGNSWIESTDNSAGTMRMSAAEHFATSGGTDTASANYGGTLNAQLLVVAALNPEMGGAIIQDSTSNNLDGQTYGSSWTSGDRVDAQFGYGLDFDAIDEYIEVPHNTAYELSNGTVELWFQGDSFSGDRGLWSKDATGRGAGGHLHLEALASGFPQVRIQSSSTNYTASGGSIFTGSWYQVATTFGSGGLKFYRNGGQTSNSTTQNITSNLEPIAIGASTITSGDLIASAVKDLWDGRIDEVRFSNIARSADWMTTEYNNYANPGTFYTVSVAEPLGSNNCATPDCDDADVCTVDWFDVGTSTCIQDTAAADGFSCAPPQACAPGGVCVLGSCASLPVTNAPTITIDSTKVTENLTNYPLLVSITDADLQANARSDGWDIWFADTDTVTKLDHEIESYDSATGTLVAWVRIPFLSSSANKVIYLNYGNPASPDQSNPPGVWDSSYAGVWHLNEDPSGTAPQSVDSTSNDNHGSSNNMTSGDLVTGKMAGALDFDGTDDWVQVAHSSSVNLTGTGMTLSGWVSSNGQTADVGILLKSTSSYQIHLGIESGETGNFRVLTPSGPYSRLDTTSTVPTNGTWTYLTATYDGAMARLYFNASEEATDARTGNINATTEPVVIGRRAIGDARFMNGAIDEVRMSNVARSAGWIQTEYNNQSSPSTFITLTPGGGVCDVGDHFVITHDGNGIHCLPETITVTVVDGAGATVTDYIKPVVLSTQNGKGTWINGGGNNGTFSDPTANDGLATYTFADTDNGVATFALDYQEGPALVDIDVFDPAIPTFRDDDTEGLIYFSASNFTVTQNGLPNPPPGTINDPIQTQTAGKDFPIHLAAYGQTANHPLCGVIETYDGSMTLKFWSTYSNPLTGTVKVTVDGTVIAQSEAAATSQTLDFSSGQGDVIVKYKDVGQIQITMKDDTVVEPAGGITGVSNLFVVKPADFDITVKRPDGSANPAGDTPGGGILTAAGAPFQAIVEVRDLEGDLTPNYGNEIAPEGIKITASTLVAPAGGRNGTNNDGAIGNNRSFAQIAPSGTFSGNAFYWDEVGAIKLQASIGDADYLGTGDVTGQESASVGRFIPDYLETSLNAPIFQTACGAGGYSYLGDSFDYLTAPMITVTAKNAAGGTTQNYNGTWAKLSAGSLTALDYDVATGALSSGAPNAPTVTQAVLGVGSLAFNNGPQLSFLRSTPEAPFYADISLGLNVFDQDLVGFPSNPVGFGAATAGWGIAFSNGKELRFGRAVLVNAHGSELLPLPVPLKTQYYNGANFIDHTSDSCTTFTAANLTMTPNPGGLSSTATVANNPLLAGDAGLALSATGSGNTGYYDLSYALTSFSWLLGDWDGDSAYDDDPASRATFGIFKGSDMLIYSREIY